MARTKNKPTNNTRIKKPPKPAPEPLSPVRKRGRKKKLPPPPRNPFLPENRPIRAVHIISDMRVLNCRTVQYLVGLTVIPSLRWVDAESLGSQWDIRTMTFWRNHPEKMQPFEPMEFDLQQMTVDRTKKQIVGRRPMARFPNRGFRLLEYQVLDGRSELPRWIEATDTEMVTDEMIREFKVKVGESR